MAAALETPVLVIIYKRAETTRKVLEALAKVKPKRIFVSANAPNPSNSADPAKVQEVRDLFDNLPWECEVTKLFRTEHLSAKLSISGGISWFFSQVEEGIVLEDDCECDPSFFYYAQELLEKYQTPSHPVPAPRLGPTRRAPLKSNFLAEESEDLGFLLRGHDHAPRVVAARVAGQHFGLAIQLFRQPLSVGLDARPHMPVLAFFDDGVEAEFSEEPHIECCYWGGDCASQVPMYCIASSRDGTA